jgi:hypothetical protein
MATQLAFNLDDRPRPRLARHTDPVTSHKAAAKIEPKLGSQCSVLLGLVEAHPGLTSAELAKLTPWPIDTRRHTAAKRLSVLRDRVKRVRNGDIRKCHVTGEEAMTWWPITNHNP